MAHASDKARLLTGQVHRQCRHLLWPAHPARRLGGNEFGARGCGINPAMLSSQQLGHLGHASAISGPTGLGGMGPAGYADGSGLGGFGYGGGGGGGRADGGLLGSLLPMGMSAPGSLPPGAAALLAEGGLNPAGIGAPVGMPSASQLRPRASERSICIRELHPHTTFEEICSEVGVYGPIEQVVLDAHKGLAHVHFLDPTSAAQLCAERSLSYSQLLAHLPCYLARADSLLLLASPRTPQSLHVAVVCHVWRVLGGRTEDVEIELAAQLPPAQTVAAFDTFHVMHACADLAAARDAADAAGSPRPSRQSLVAQRLDRCVELATAHQVNRAVRDVLPRVCKAAELRAAEASQADGTGAARTPAASDDAAAGAASRRRSSCGLSLALRHCGCAGQCGARASSGARASGGGKPPTSSSRLSRSWLQPTRASARASARTSAGDASDGGHMTAPTTLRAAVLDGLDELTASGSSGGAAS
jgi:hypothetical protein